MLDKCSDIMPEPIKMNVHDYNTTFLSSSHRQLIISERGEEVPIVIVGNKADLPPNKRAVVKETAEAIACMDWNTGYVEATAKDNSRVVAVFKEILRQSKISYDLSPAVRRRRQSLPVLSSKEKPEACVKAKNNRTSLVRRLFMTQTSSPC